MKFLIQKFVRDYHIITISAFLAVTFMFSSCNDDKPADNSKNVIKIGALIPITGSGSSTGESMLEAIKYSIAEQNELLINQPLFELFPYDTETNPQKALDILKTFKSMGITFVVGPYSSAELEFIKDYANDNNIVLLSPSSVSISLAIAKDNVFRLATNDYHQVTAISKYFETQMLKKVVAVNRNDVWGNSLYTAVNEKSQSSDYQLTNQIQYNTDLNDFSLLSADIENKIISNINNDNFDDIAVYLACFNEGTEILAKSSGKENSEKVRWLGTSAYALNSTILTNNTAFDFAVKTNLTCPVYAPDESYNSVLAPVQSYLKSKIGREPESYAYTAYDAAKIAINSAYQIRINPSLKPADAVIQYCNSNSGITGTLELDEFGDRKAGNYNFWQLRKVDSKNEWFIKYIYSSKTDELIEIQ